MKRAARLLIALVVVGCSTQRATLEPIYPGPGEIYAVPESEAFAIAHRAIVTARPGYQLDRVDIYEMGGSFPGYQVAYESGFSPWACFVQRLYVIPVTGVAPDGRETAGFRFVITGDGRPLGLSLEQDKHLAAILKAALDATGTATAVRDFRVRVNDKGPPPAYLLRENKPGFVYSSCPLSEARAARQGY